MGNFREAFGRAFGHALGKLRDALGRLRVPLGSSGKAFNDIQVGGFGKLRADYGEAFGEASGRFGKALVGIVDLTLGKH